MYLFGVLSCPHFLPFFVTLTDAFPQDHFRRQKRGISSGDLIQRIRTGSNVLDTPIVYDNKNANTVTKADVTKAKKYQKIHGTTYVLIVGNNLPKTSVPNGLLGEKDGIILVHPSIVFEVSKRIRDGIIEISKLSLGNEDRPVFGGLIVTEIVLLIKFYPAEEYHKKYYDQNKDAPYCRFVIDPKVEKLLKQYGNELKSEFIQ